MSEQITREELFSQLETIERLTQNEQYESAREAAILLRKRYDASPNGDNADLLNAILFTVGLEPYTVERRRSFSYAEALQVEKNRVRLNKGNDLILHKEQEQVYLKLLSGTSILLTAPTSFGKSALIDAFICTKRPKCCVILVPTIALLDEVRRRLQSHAHSYKILTQATASPAEYSIYVMTPERYLEIQDRPSPDFFVIDEFYKLSIPYDSKLQSMAFKSFDERSIALNLCYRELTSTRAQFLMCSPYVESIGEVLCLHGERFTTNLSPVLQQYEYRINWKRESDRVPDIKDLIREGSLGQTLVYCKSPESSESLAMQLTDVNPTSDNELIHSLCAWLGRHYGTDWSLITCLRHRIGYHHSPLPRAIQRTLIRLFNECHLSILTCTSTIIEGVNTSAETVIIFDNKQGNKIIRDRFTFNNIAGRAGRLGKHFTGRIISYYHLPDAATMSISSPLIELPNDAPGELLAHLPKKDLTNHALIASRTEFLDGLRLPETLATLLTGRDLVSAARLLNHLESLSRDSFTRLSENAFETSALFSIIQILRETVYESSSTKQVNWYIGQIRNAYTHAGDIASEIRSTMDRSSSPQMTFDFACKQVFRFHRNELCFRIPRDLHTFEIVYNFLADTFHTAHIDLSVHIANISSEFLPPFVNTLEEYGIPTPIGMKLSKMGFAPNDSDELIPQAIRASNTYLASEHCTDIERWFLSDFLQGVTPALQS